MPKLSPFSPIILTEYASHELIAHNRDDNTIALHIGAEKVIFQELDDLKEACVQAVCNGTIGRKDQEFEVGVFNGEYVTPVPDGYFAHLERIRGETKRLKVMESAREAVANGSAGTGEIQMVTNGVEVNGDGKVVAASSPPLNGSPPVNGVRTANGRRMTSSQEQEASPRNRMDNFTIKQTLNTPSCSMS